MPRRFMLVIAAVFILSAVLSLSAAQGSQVNTGSLRVVNALVGLGAVDVYLNDERIAFGLPPADVNPPLQPQGATPYFTVTAGKHRLAVRPANADPFSAPVADLLIDLPPNNSQTAIVYQKEFARDSFVPSYEQAGAMVVLNDDRSPTRLGNARLAAVHLAVGAPETLSIGWPSGASLLHRLEREKPSGTIDVPAGQYSLNVIDADSPGLDLLQRVGDYDFFANTLYTLVIVPAVRPQPLPQGGAGFTVGPGSPEPALFVVSAPLDPPQDEGIRLRVIHAAHSTAVLDLYLDGRLVASRLNYSRITEYLGLDSYSHTIALRRTGASADSPPLAQACFTISLLNRDQKTWTLLLLNATDTNAAALNLVESGETCDRQGTNPTSMVNTPGGSLLMALLPDNISSTQRGYARIRLINAADGVPSLRIQSDLPPVPEPAPGETPAPTVTPSGPLEPLPLVNSVLFGAEASDAEVLAGLYTELAVVPGGGSQKLLTVENRHLVEGMVYTFVVMGSPAGDPPLSLHVLEDYGFGVSIDRQYLGTVITDTGNVRSAPNTTSSVVARLPFNEQVQVLGRNFNGDWIRIRFNNPLTQQLEDGWIFSPILSVTRLGTPLNVLALPVFEGG